ncbi:hypothetical protein HMPREF9098_0663 [Kingella denitrificans ATCC 33394]|uniref:Uncharacterized protein n=1 Tax=Kingella denitrificans ATCC 33394 TaxID=888741 RepID=F0EXV3_9NEIS|nr:hypothetical protein HMPREF9098_0663 [Kingella denitrificans ATCC 33394]
MQKAACTRYPRAMTALYTEFAVVPPESCYNAPIRAAQKQPALFGR